MTNRLIAFCALMCIIVSIVAFAVITANQANKASYQAEIVLAESQAAINYAAARAIAVDTYTTAAITILLFVIIASMAVIIIWLLLSSRPC